MTLSSAQPTNVKRPSERVAVVSAADQKYYPLLLECLASVKQAWPDSAAALTLCAIGADLDAQQVGGLERRNIKFAEIRNDFSLSRARLRGRKYLLASLVRACLPEYFPGYEIYVWMDADSWLCDFAAMDLYLQAARQGKLGIVANFDRYTEQAFTADGWLFKWARIRNFYAKNAARSGLSREEFQHLAARPCLYSGNFSLHSDAPHWSCYQKNLRRVVSRGRIFGSDQLALGMTVYLDGMPAELLPRWCNWTSVARPKYDRENQRFVEPGLPNYPIGIMHLTGQDLMRLDRSYKVPVEDLDGGITPMSLRFPVSKA